MASTAVKTLTPLLNLPLVRQTRRNHGIEHATIHLLSQRIPGLRIAGRSDATGFVLIGTVETEAVVQAVSDALRRLQRGEHGLAIHPNCGTNLVTTGYLTSFAAMLSLAGTGSERERWLHRLPVMVMASMIAILIAQPLGTWLQRHITTDGDPADTEVLSIKRHETTIMGRKTVVHRVNTRSV